MIVLDRMRPMRDLPKAWVVSVRCFVVACCDVPPVPLAFIAL